MFRRRLAILLIPAAIVPVGLARAASEKTVTASGQSFSPKSAAIAPGDTVKWENEGGTHNVVFDDGSYTSGNPAGAGTLGSRTFESAGTFAYHCQVHGSAGGGGMSGTVVVGTPAEPTPSPSPGPQPTATPTLSGTPPPAGTATPSPEPTAAPAPTIDAVRFRRTVVAGRLRGRISGQPAGARLVVRVRRGLRRAGRFTTTIDDEPTRVSLELRAAVRRALADAGRVRVKISIALTSDAGRDTARRRVRLRDG